ncbi:MAG: ankyrin repeat domain-containing protein [Bryobacteraceae bacterium]
MDLKPLPPRPSLEQFRKQAKDLVKACESGDSEATRRFRKYHPRFRPLRNAAEAAKPGSGRFALADAQWVIAREHGFDSWPKFTKHIVGLTRANSNVSKFEWAADAIVAGDAATLQRLLREDAELIRARSARVHRATLLHYIGANGVENYRQKSPANAVEIAKILLQAGAEVDAVADSYGKSTTLDLVATSIHALLAGVQEALMETLLEAGATVNPDGRIVHACLANGRGQAAEFLAGRGARLDLESAAGVGRLDVVGTYFNDDGALQAHATGKQIQSGLNWACEYGRNKVVEFLLEKGADPGAAGDNGQTALHWAAIGGHLDTVESLLERKAPLEVKNVYGGTVLGQAAWCVMHGDRRVDYIPIVETLLRAGAKVQGAGYPTGNERLDELLRRHGAES